VKFISARNEHLVREDGLTYFIDTSNPPSRFCDDIALGVHEGWTVTFAALQIAYFLGFQDVIIIGLDHRYQFEGRPNDVSIMREGDPNHFSDGYFGAGQDWDNPDLARSEESYRIARQQFEAAGRRIVDATVDGACREFEKVNYEEYFRLGA